MFFKTFGSVITACHICICFGDLRTLYNSELLPHLGRGNYVIHRNSNRVEEDTLVIERETDRLLVWALIGDDSDCDFSSFLKMTLQLFAPVFIINGNKFRRCLNAIYHSKLRKQSVANELKYPFI